MGLILIMILLSMARNWAIVVQPVNTKELKVQKPRFARLTLLILKEFRYNPVNQKIFGKIEGESTDSYWIDLRGYDNIGNEVVFFLASISSEDIVFKYVNFHRDLSDEITSITLTPYATKIPEDREMTSNDVKKVGKEFTIFLEK